jgi:hypothetical protein
MRLVMLLLAGGLAGCGPSTFGPSAYLRSPTAISIQATEDKRQAVEDMANAHCRSYGLVPRLHSSGVASEPTPALVAWLYFYRYECHTAPRP